MTEIRGPWPPPPPLAPPPPQHPQRSIPSPRGASLTSAFQQPQVSQRLPPQQQALGPSWRQLDDGSWFQPGREVDWADAGAGLGAFGPSPAEELLTDPLVGAASRSPPLSPTTTRLLAMKRPSGDLRRGPQRAPSLGLAPLERQPSRLSPERQYVPAGLGPSPSQGSAPPPPPPQQQQQQLWRAVHPQQAQQEEEIRSSSRGSSSGSGGQQASQHALQQQPLLPVHNASPDVQPASGSLPAPASPFPASAAAGSGGYAGIGGLPVGALDKRERQWNRAADLSPRDVSGTQPCNAAWRLVLGPQLAAAPRHGCH